MYVQSLDGSSYEYEEEGTLYAEEEVTIVVKDGEEVGVLIVKPKVAGSTYSLKIVNNGDPPVDLGVLLGSIFGSLCGCCILCVCLPACIGYCIYAKVKASNKRVLKNAGRGGNYNSQPPPPMPPQQPMPPPQPMMPMDPNM